MTPRLRPLEPSEWSEEVRRILGGTLEGGAREQSRPPNILGTIAHHPSLLGPFLGFAATLATRGELPRRDSELLALRTAWNCRSAFEWGHHAVYARAAGLDDEEIDRVCLGPAHEGWTCHERLLLEAADELHLEHQITDETWKRLEEELDAAQLVELPFVVGNYAMLSMVANATGVLLEEGLPGLPASPAADVHVLTAPKQG